MKGRFNINPDVEVIINIRSNKRMTEAEKLQTYIDMCKTAETVFGLENVIRRIEIFKFKDGFKVASTITSVDMTTESILFYNIDEEEVQAYIEMAKEQFAKEALEREQKNETVH